ncbi:MAG: zinc ribbon domain-containing protein [Culicoidibacterales bacterium]
MKQICQSCGMPLMQKGMDLRGSERGSGKSEKYCAYCYGNGAFLQPTITKAQMIARGIDGINRSKANKFVKWVLVKSYPFQLKQLERWRDK